MNKKKKATTKDTVLGICWFIGLMAAVIGYTVFVSSRYPEYYIGKVIVWSLISLVFIVLITQSIMKKELKGTNLKYVIYGTIISLIVLMNIPVIPYYMDIPSFLSNNYSTANGVISSKWHTSGKGSDHSTHITVSGKNYIVVEDGINLVVGDNVTLEYLPHSHIIKTMKLAN